MPDETRQPEPMLRASDAEREQTLNALRAHHAAGRLQTNELDQRIARALTATTVAELDDQLRDLPNLRTHRSGRRWATHPVVMILALTVAATAIALSNGVPLVWILPLLWFAGPWHRHPPRIPEHVFRRSDPSPTKQAGGQASHHLRHPPRHRRRIARPRPRAETSVTAAPSTRRSADGTPVSCAHAT